jgi:hypothetical protein
MIQKAKLFVSTRRTTFVFTTFSFEAILRYLLCKKKTVVNTPPFKSRRPAASQATSPSTSRTLQKPLTSISTGSRRSRPPTPASWQPTRTSSSSASPSRPTTPPRKIYSSTRPVLPLRCCGSLRTLRVPVAWPVGPTSWWMTAP